MKRLALAATLLLCACSRLSPEARVRDRLERAGVAPAMAQCMAHRLVRKLDSGELRELARVASMPRGSSGRLTVDELAERVATLHDPHIVSVVARVGLGCAIAG